MLTVSDLRLEVIEAVTEHPEFREQVRETPRQTIRAAFGLEVPDTFELAVHEDAADVVHVVLPPDPALELSELQDVSGGHWAMGQNHTHDSDNYWEGGDPHL